MEYQGRGSPHVHCILWADIGCDTEALLHTMQGRVELAQKIQAFAIAELPVQGEIDPNATPNKELLAPMFYRATSDHDSVEGKVDLYNLVAACQVHNHKSTCYKKNKLRKVCRFHFPFEVTDHTSIELDKDGTLREMQVLYKRNHRWINRYNPLLLQLWRGNTDCAFIGNPYGIAYYAASYAAKGEPDRIAFREALSKSLRKVGDGATPNTKLRSVAMAAMGAREMSLQECLWILTGYKCTDVSREFISLNVGKPELRNLVFKSAASLVSQADGDANVFISNKTTKYIDAYSLRSSELEDISLLEFVSTYNLSATPPTTNTRLTRFKLQSSMGWISEKEKAAVVLLYPKVGFDYNNEAAAYAILMAYIPWRQVDHILCGKESAVEALATRLPTLSAKHRNLIELNARNHTVQQNAREHQRQQSEPTTFAEEFTTLDASNPMNAAFLPASIAEQLQSDDVVDGIVEEPYNGEQFRPRTVYSAADIRKAHSFVEEQVKRFNEERQAHLAQFQQQPQDNTVNAPMSEKQQELQNMVAKLNADQSAAYQIIAHHVKREQQCLMAVMGPAGTGKSFLIDTVVLLVLLHYGHTGGYWGPILKAAHTGIAAFNIGGVTIYHAFHVSVRDHAATCSDENGLKLQQELAGLKVLIIDEVSMIADFLLAKLDACLRKAFPDKQDTPFGGVHIIVVGDFYQLKPISGAPLYKDDDSPGRSLWKMITKKTILLRIQQRQHDGDPLGAICNNARRITEEDINTLNTRFLPSAVPPDALFTSPTNSDVNNLNTEKLQTLGAPIITCWAQHAPTLQAATMSHEVLLEHHSAYLRKTQEGEEVFDNLYNYIRLAVGARVMLRKNTATTLGLVNGATGTVYDFIYNPSLGNPIPHATVDEACKNPRLQLPIVLVQFDAEFYKGPSFVPGVERVVPICSKTVSYKFDESVC